MIVMLCCLLQIVVVIGSIACCLGLMVFWLVLACLLVFALVAVC